MRHPVVVHDDMRIRGDVVVGNKYTITFEDRGSLVGVFGTNYWFYPITTSPTYTGSLTNVLKFAALKRDE